MLCLDESHPLHFEMCGEGRDVDPDLKCKLHNYALPFMVTVSPVGLRTWGALYPLRVKMTTGVVYEGTSFVSASGIQMIVS